MTRDEALAALGVFIEQRLPDFGRYEDAMLTGDPWMAHSLLSVPLNLGLLDPPEVIEAAEIAYRNGRLPLNAVEGFIRQILGWREYMWHLYWWLPSDYPTRNYLDARNPLPEWFEQMESSPARCLDVTLREVRETGWAHHIQRLMILGSWALQRGTTRRSSTTGSGGRSSMGTTGSCSATSSACPNTPMVGSSRPSRTPPAGPISRR